VYSELVEKIAQTFHLMYRQLSWNLFNEDPQAVVPSTSVLSSSLSFSKDRNSFAEQHTILVKSSLEANHEVCLNGEDSINQPVSGRANDDLDSTNSNGAMGPSAMAKEIKEQVSTYI